MNVDENLKISSQALEGLLWFDRDGGRYRKWLGNLLHWPSPQQNDMTFAPFVVTRSTILFLWTS